jgi:hypothetical protein
VILLLPAANEVWEGGTLQRLIRYQAHSPILGWVRGRDERLLTRPADEDTAAAHLGATP